MDENTDLISHIFRVKMNSLFSHLTKKKRDDKKIEERGVLSRKAFHWKALKIYSTFSTESSSENTDPVTIRLICGGKQQYKICFTNLLHRTCKNEKQAESEVTTVGLPTDKVRQRSF